MPPRFETLADWLSWQEQLHSSAVDLGLERIHAVLERLAPDLSSAVIITVGGTNGKGSTLAFLDAIYRRAGYRTGLFTSPHFVDYCERIRIDGDKVTESDLCAAFAAIDEARGDISLTYFEFSTLAALWLFAREDLSVVLLEVGLGGRLDASNVVDADVAIVASVSIDHRDWLGDTREAIGREKAGIFRSGCPAISGDRQPPATLRETAGSIGSHWYGRGEQFDVQVHQSQNRHDHWSLQWGTLSVDLPWPSHLKAPIQLDNAACAAMAVFLLEERRPVARDALAEGIRDARLTGRLQVWRERPRVILDVAHNEAAARALFGAIAGIPRNDLHLVLAMLKDKEVRDTSAVFGALQPRWHLASPAVDRGMPVADLRQQLPGVAPEDTTEYASVGDAYRGALAAASEDDLIVVTGSFFTVAEVMGLPAEGAL